MERESGAIRHASRVITGEDRLDSQSLVGKVPVGEAKIAQRFGYDKNHQPANTYRVN